ncbi:hypothetical protein ID866_7687 [Astraeus odoratus]|nr:hypothetical protein ID866_7687 [Astraeus odoratus]
MPGRYAPLPTQQPSRDADRELDEAFASDDEDNDDLQQARQHYSLDRAQTGPTQPVQGVAADTSSNKAGSDGPGTCAPAPYDFERDFDYVRPPPGSPPRPSAAAVPNDIGNTNGILPTSPIDPASGIPRPSFFRRAVGAILPTHYTRLPSSAEGSHSTVWGGGTENDGVFSNVTAKPSASVRTRAGDNDIHMVPEEEQSVAPPSAHKSYAIAQADAVPPYWETTVHAPSGMDTSGGMIIEDLPTGSLLTFLANMFTSFFFQFVGFLLTYLLHTTHAAKFGSRAGLGLTLIQYGIYSRSGDDAFGPSPPVEDVPGDQFSDTVYASTQSSDAPPVEDSFTLNITSRDWMSFLLMTLGERTIDRNYVQSNAVWLGWFILLTSCSGFWRVKHWESSIRASNARGPPTPEDIERDIATRHNIEEIFGIPPEDEASPPGTAPHIPTQRELEEARLHNDLRAAGLL